MAAESRYRERLRPPWWLWLVCLALAASMGLVWLVVVGPVGALLFAVALAAVAWWGLWRWSATVEVTDTELRVGRAHIPLALTGPAVPLDGERAAWARGPGIDPAAYHLIRGWVPTAVLIDVVDPADPTPYWYVATRRPRELAAAVDSARQEANGR